MPVRTEATLEDLYRVPENGKAGIVNGELRLTSPTGACRFSCFAASDFHGQTSVA
jgi:hypothetical protein